jgi:hypothetical protein
MTDRELPVRIIMLTRRRATRPYALVAFVMFFLLAAYAARKEETIGSRWPIYLNHVYVVPAADTYESVSRNDFLLNDFAAAEMRTTVRQDRTYTGFYFYGEHTYFELLEPSKSAQKPESLSGIAFGAERPGQIKDLAASLARSGAPNVSLNTITRETEGDNLNWFVMLSTEATLTKSKLATWVMEYDPDFLSRWYPRFPPHTPSIS